jgi:uncharacterized protein
MEITPLVPVGRQLIETYGNGRFVIAGVAFEGSVLVFPRRTLAWPVRAVDELSKESLNELVEGDLVERGEVDILVLGTGAHLTPIPPDLRYWLRQHGIVVECMDTGAACRTYNVLLAEERRVAAALIAVS